MKQTKRKRPPARRRRSGGGEGGAPAQPAPPPLSERQQRVAELLRQQGGQEVVRTRDVARVLRFSTDQVARWLSPVEMRLRPKGERRYLVLDVVRLLVVA